MKTLLITLFIALLTITGCGDLKDNKVIKKELDTSILKSSCKLETNQFFDILTKNISSQILCLRDNMYNFIDLVESNRPGYISRTELESYIKKNRADISPDMLRALKAVFDLNHLATGADRDYISRQNLDQLVEFALVFNDQASKHLGALFKRTIADKYDVHKNHRERVRDAARVIVQALLKIFKKERGNEVHKLKISEILESFQTDDTIEIVGKIKKLLFVKKILLGGDKDELNHLEVSKAMVNLDDLLVVTLDLIRFEHLTLSQKELLDMLAEDVRVLNENIFDPNGASRDQEHFLSVDDAFSTVKMFVSESEFDVDRYKDLILEGKRLLMGGNTSIIKGGEVKNLLNSATLWKVHFRF